MNRFQLVSAALAAALVAPALAWPRFMSPRAQDPGQAAPAAPAPQAPDAPKAAKDRSVDIDALNRALDRWQKENDAWMQEMLQAKPGAAATPGGYAQRSFQSVTVEDGVERTLSFEIDPDGKVHGKVVTKKDDETNEEDFEADSIEALKEQRPELAKELDQFTIRELPDLDAPAALPDAFREHERMLRDLLEGLRGPAGLQGTFRDPFAPPPPASGGSAAPDASRDDLPLLPPPAQAGPRLGVQARSIGADDPLRSHLDLPAGVGLLIDAVQPGSLADLLKLKRHDVLVRIQGREIRSPADVADALRSAGQDPLKVEVVRGGHALELTQKSGSA